MTSGGTEPDDVGADGDADEPTDPEGDLIKDADIEGSDIKGSDPPDEPASTGPPGSAAER